MKKRILLSSMLLSLSLYGLSGCGATPMGNRNVSQNNTQNVVYTKHGKISGQAATAAQENATYNTSMSSSDPSHRPFHWPHYWRGLSTIYNSPSNTVTPEPNAPDTLPNQTNQTPNGGSNVGSPPRNTGAGTNNSSGTSAGQTTPNNPSTNQNSSDSVQNNPSNYQNGGDTAANPTQPAHPNGSANGNTASNSTSQMDTLASQVIIIVNTTRKNNGLPPLKMDSDLVKMANMKAQDMLNHNYFSHTSPTYGSPFDMMNKLGISYTAAGENIAEGQTTATQVMTDWMNSPGHRANILSKNYTSIGVGHTSNKNYWVQEFIKK